MRVNTNDLYRDTITILNKLDARDATLKKDAWYKTVIPDCMWTERITRTVTSDGTVNIGSSFQIQIPDNENYRSYKDWMKPENRDKLFTVRQGDYLIRGEVPEEITPENIRSVVAKYEPEACQVKTFRDLRRSELKYVPSALMRFAEILEIEGV